MITLILMEGTKRLYHESIPLPGVPLTLRAAVKMTVKRAREKAAFQGKITALTPLVVNGGVKDSTPDTIVTDGVYVCVVIGTNALPQPQEHSVSFWLD